MAGADRIGNAYLVAAGQFHDIDFARLELLKLLAEHDNVRCTVAADYRDTAAIGASERYANCMRQVRIDH